ncbi:MAG TPA: MlaD family protein [Kiritimatiellia bacterium]|nr:MlaD family protein [Kiritimatiellia bacterium]
MKAKPFKFRYVNEIVGGFVLLVGLAVIATIVIAGRAQEWFVPVHRVAMDFPPEGSLGLQIGSEVQILGTTVGRVRRIAIDEEGFMTGEFTVKGDFIQFVRTDSDVIVKRRFGIAGDSFIDISKGSGPLLPEGAAVVVSRDTEVTEVIERILAELESRTLPLLDKALELLEEYRGLAADLRDPEQPIQQMLENLNSIVAALERGEGPAGQLLRDEEMAAKFQEMADRVQAILDDVQATTARLPSMAASVEGEMRQLPGTVLQAQDTLRETERLIEGVQRHWIIRRHIPQSEPVAILPTASVPSRRPAMSHDQSTTQGEP